MDSILFFSFVGGLNVFDGKVRQRMVGCCGDLNVSTSAIVD